MGIGKNDPLRQSPAYIRINFEKLSSNLIETYIVEKPMERPTKCEKNVSNSQFSIFFMTRFFLDAELLENFKFLKNYP